MTLSRICIHSFSSRANRQSLLQRENTLFLPRLYPMGRKARSWIAPERLFGEQTALFAYPEGQRRKRNQVWRLLSSLDDLRLFDIALHIMTPAVWRWCSHISDISNHFRFVCLREEEVGELLSCEERLCGQGRCSLQEQHTEAGVVT